MFYRKKKPVYATKQPNAKQVELSGLHNCGVALTGPKAPDTPFVSVEAGFFNQLQYIENTKRDLPKKKLVYSTKPGKIDNDDNDVRRRRQEGFFVIIHAFLRLIYVSLVE